MKINKLIIKNKIVLIFSIMIIIGIYVHEDYGLSIDDEIYRLNGLFYKNFISEYLRNLFFFNFENFSILEDKISNYTLGNHPALFETILAFVADIFSIKKYKFYLFIITYDEFFYLYIQFNLVL